MTNNEIEQKMKSLVHDERRITAEILSLINLAEERRLHLARGYSSLFDWLTRGFGYSASAACRRIDAARLMRRVPEAAEKIQSGVVNLTTLAKARQLIRAQEKISGQLSPDRVCQAVAVIENKSSEQAEKSLFALLPDAASAVSHERKTPIGSDEMRFSFNLSGEALADLEWVKSHLSHSIPFGETAVVFARLLKEFRERHDPAKKKRSTAKVEREVVAPVTQVTRSTSPNEIQSEVNFHSQVGKSSAQIITTAAVVKISPIKRDTVRRNNVRNAVKQELLNKAHSACEYLDLRTGKRCGSKYQIQIDHIVPRVIGGTDDVGNLRCLCAAHNRWVAERALGKSWANAWQRQHKM